MQKNLSPHFYAMSTVVTGLVSFIIYDHYDFLDDYYFLPLFVLALIFAAGNLYKQWLSESDFQLATNVDMKNILRRAVARYIVWLLVFGVGFLFIQQHPFYSSEKYVRSLDFLGFYFQLYVMAGLPYFVVTLLVKSSHIEDFYDPAIRFIHITKSILLRWREGSAAPYAVLRRPYNRKVVLNLLMRGYFLPTMVVQIYNTLSSAITASSDHFHNYNMLSILMCITSLLWLMDATIASMSYSIESRWLENRSRSLDLTAGGWLICFSCYAPLNEVTSVLFPFAPLVSDHSAASLVIANDTMLYAITICESVLLAFLIYADASLGPSIANISLKKLQTRGLFGIVRHPVYTIKIIMWWVASLGYRKFWTYKYILGQVGWTLIYVLRAISEERHLKKFAEYRDYMKKVRYRFLPWLF